MDLSKAFYTLDHDLLIANYLLMGLKSEGPAVLQPTTAYGDGDGDGGDGDGDGDDRDVNQVCNT